MAGNPTKHRSRLPAFAAALLPVMLPALLMATPASAAGPAYEEDTDRPNLDFKWFDLPRPWPQLCQEACATTDRCQAWSYIKPNVRGPLASCWLKDAVPPATSNTCCVSGVR